MRKLINITGQRFGDLEVIKRTQDKISASGRKSVQWLCRCDCGNEIIIAGSSLKRNITKSCGCLRKNIKTIHGLSNTKMYQVWKGIKQRCNNKNNKAYKNYGGRGIEMCKKWFDNFEIFYKDMEEKYKKGLTLDRIDNNKGYFKENCRWTTMEDQGNNKRNNVLITYKGETKTLKWWSIYLGINYNTLFSRITKLNWSIEKAFKV